MQEVCLLSAVTRSGPGGVTDEDIDVAALKLWEALRSDERGYLYGVCIAENGCSYDATEVDIEATESAVGVNDAETRKGVVTTALEFASSLNSAKSATL